jgi:hypothetical protein
VKEWNLDLIFSREAHGIRFLSQCVLEPVAAAQVPGLLELERGGPTHLQLRST